LFPFVSIRLLVRFGTCVLTPLSTCLFSFAVLPHSAGARSAVVSGLLQLFCRTFCCFVRTWSAKWSVVVSLLRLPLRFSCLCACYTYFHFHFCSSTASSAVLLLLCSTVALKLRYPIRLDLSAISFFGSLPVLFVALCCTGTRSLEPVRRSLPPLRPGPV
jgi:hypothetical protein